MPSPDQIEEWLRTRRFQPDRVNDSSIPVGNIAIRLPENVVGVDVDNYGDKHGAKTLARLEKRLGSLPDTFRSSSRDDGVSGIYLFRCTPGRRLGKPVKEDGGGIEFIQFGHRYVVVKPSIHPEGGEYVWYGPDGTKLPDDEIPFVSELPELPERWDRYLLRLDPVVGVDAPELPEAHVAEWVAGDDRPMCRHTERVTLDVAGRLALSGEDGAHDIARDGLWGIVRDSMRGHRGLATAEAIVRKQFLAEVTARRGRVKAENEYVRMLTRAVSKTIHEFGSRDEDDWCELPADANSGSTGTSEVTRIAEDMENRYLARKLFDAKRYQEMIAMSKGQRHMTGLEFLESVKSLPPLWGEGQEVLWITGEALLIAGGDGVGKTTTLQQLMLARIGFWDDLWGLPVAPATGRGLYLAMDRPLQAARSLRRMVSEEDHGIVHARLQVWNGPLPVDIMSKPSALADWISAEFGEIEDVYVDSYKDLVPSLVEDAAGIGLNAAMQEVLARGTNWVGLHHQRKANGQNKTPTELSDVYGSRWLTAGVGSVVFLDGGAGAFDVDVKHLKQPLGRVGPLTVHHSHLTGRSNSVRPSVGEEGVLRDGPACGMTVRAVASATHGGAVVESEPILKRTRRRLDALVSAGKATRVPGKRGGKEGSTADVYQWVREP